MWDSFVILKNSPRNVIPGIRYDWNSSYQVCVKYSMDCAIIEGDSLALFTAQMYADCRKYIPKIEELL